MWIMVMVWIMVWNPCALRMRRAHECIYESQSDGHMYNSEMSTMKISITLQSILVAHFALVSWAHASQLYQSFDADAHIVMHPTSRRLLDANELQPSDIAFCPVHRDSFPDLFEWVMYHNEVLGVQRFYIFDHSSRLEPLKQSLTALFPLIQKGVVVYSYFTKMLPLNLPFRYSSLVCLQRFRQLHKWMAFTDIDEFFILKVTPQPSPHGALASFLKDFEGGAGIGGVGVSWLQFGSDGHKTRPSGGVLGNYAKCWPNEHVKTLVLTDKVVVEAPTTPHNMAFIPGHNSVDVNKKVIPSPGWTHATPVINKLVIAHYTIKSREDFELKMKKGTSDGGSKDEGYWNAVEAETSQTKSEELNSTCRALLKYKGKFVTM